VPTPDRPQTTTAWRRFVPWQGSASRTDTALLGARAILGLVALGLVLRRTHSIADRRALRGVHAHARWPKNWHPTGMRHSETRTRDRRFARAAALAWSVAFCVGSGRGGGRWSLRADGAQAACRAGLTDDQQG
jgi:hypothetical protein